VDGPGKVPGLPRISVQDVALSVLGGLPDPQDLHHAGRRVHLVNDDLGRHGRQGSVKNLGRYAASWSAWWPSRPSSTAALT